MYSFLSGVKDVISQNRVQFVPIEVQNLLSEESNSV